MFKYLIRVLINPKSWLQNNLYSADWDFELKQLLCEHKFERIDDYVVRLGDVVIWVENHPYASFRPYTSVLYRQPDDFVFHEEERPSRRTIFYAMDRLVDDTR